MKNQETSLDRHFPPRLQVTAMASNRGLLFMGYEAMRRLRLSLELISSHAGDLAGLLSQITARSSGAGIMSGLP